MVKSYENSWLESQIPYTFSDVSRPEFEQMKKLLNTDLELSKSYSLRYNPKVSMVSIFLNEEDKPITRDEDMLDENTQKRTRSVHRLLTRFLDNQRILEGPWER